MRLGGFSWSDRRLSGNCSLHVAWGTGAGQCCTAVGRSGADGDREMCLEGARVEERGADPRVWPFATLNAKILPRFVRCHLGLGETCVLFPKVEQTCGDRLAACDTESLLVAFVWPFLRSC